jgi:hypothetical protein
VARHIPELTGVHRQWDGFCAVRRREDEIEEAFSHKQHTHTHIHRVADPSCSPSS